MSKLRPVIRRVDEVQRPALKELERKGYSTKDLHIIGHGFADSIVANWGVNLLVEFKSSWLEGLTPDESDFFKNWKGPKIVATCAKEVEDWFAEMGY